MKRFLPSKKIPNNLKNAIISAIVAFWVLISVIWAISYCFSNLNDMMQQNELSQKTMGLWVISNQLS